MKRVIPPSVLRDYEESARLLKRAQHNDPNYKIAQQRAYRAARREIKSSHGFMKKVNIGVLLASAGLGLGSAYQAYQDTQKLENPSYVQKLSQEEVDQLRGEVGMNEAIALLSTGMAGVGGLGRIVYGKSEKEELKKERNNLAQRLSGIFGAASLSVGLFLLSGNITGNSIANSIVSSQNIISAVLLLLGLIGLYFCFKK